MVLKKDFFRIWKKNAELPGLAMSRNIGDRIAKEIGVTSKPDIIVKEIQAGNIKFIILASDGIWDYLSNEKVKDIVLQYCDN